MNTLTNDIIPQGYKMTELGALPEEWEVMPLDNKYIEFQNGLWKGKKEPYIKVRVLRNTNFNNDGTIDFEDVAELNVEQRNFKNREIIKDDIILERSGGGPTQPVGRVVFFEREDQFTYSFSNFTSRIRINDNLIIFPKFLFYFLLDFYNQGKTNDIQNRTTGIRNLDFSRYKQIPIPLPPLLEQQKIAAVLSAVQEAKEKTEAVIAAAKALKKSMMKHLFTYGPVSPQEAENVPLKETEIGPVPEDWEVVRLGDTFEFSKKPRNLKIKNDDFVPFIPMEMISETNKSIKSWEEKRYSEISSGSFVFRKDIIIAKITPSFENGKQAILDNLPTDFGYATTEIWALHPAKNKKSITYYLHYYLKISSIRKILAGKMEGSTGRQRLPKHVLENLPMPLPPLPIQQKIASILSAIDEKIEAEENKKKALEDLFKSLLHNLMTAKIRVNQLEISS